MNSDEYREIGMLRGQITAQQQRLDRMEDKLDVIFQQVTSAKGGAKTLITLISVTVALTTLINNLGAVAKWLSSS